jgi:hypothetical protein
MELILVPEVGGRVMAMKWRGHDLCFTQPERRGHVEDVARVSDVRAWKRGMGFPLWGGDKTWLAPQAAWTDGLPFLDLDSGPYEVATEQLGPEQAVVQMTSRPCRETGIQVSRTVVVSAETPAEWTVYHRLLNTGATETEWGIWVVNQVMRPGVVYLPRRAASRHPDGVKTYEEEGESARVRDAVVGQLDGLAAVACRQPVEFKFGVDADEGWLLGIVEVPGLGLVGYRKQAATYADGPYAHGCVAEVYNSHRYDYLEMELHGPLTWLTPGATVELEERQALFDVAAWPRDEAEVRRYLSTAHPAAP